MTEEKALCLLKFIHETEEPLKVLLIENVEYIHKLRLLMPRAELFVVAADEDLPQDEEFQNMGIHWVTMNYLGEKLPLEEEYFDIIIGEELFLEAWNPQDIASGLGLYLKDTGCLLTSFTNARYWKNIRDLMEGHFYHVCTHVFTRDEMLSLLAASFYKDAYFLPADDGSRVDEDFIGRLENMGFENHSNDLGVRTWLVQATKSIGEIIALKKLYTKEVRRELSNRLRRIEYGIDVAENTDKLWQLFEKNMIFPEYVADFVKQAIIHRKALAENLVFQLQSMGHGEWAHTFLKAVDMLYITSSEECSVETTVEASAEKAAEHSAVQKKAPITESSAAADIPPEQRIAFVTCVSKEDWYYECQLYIKNLKVPEGMKVELIPVRGAKSMCHGYNVGMRQTDAKYKVYLHQDTFIANKNFIGDLLNIFKDKTIGALGVIGARKLPKSGIWWDGLRTVGRVLHACEAESVVDSTCQDIDGDYVDVDAVDGLLFATQVDLPWREDLFTGWHFYEIAQSMEMWRHGYKVVVPQQEDAFWCIHCPKEKPLDSSYKKYQKIFLKEYGGELNPEI